jgi:hypothetical protein
MGLSVGLGTSAPRKLDNANVLRAPRHLFEKRALPAVGVEVVSAAICNRRPALRMKQLGFGVDRA